MLRAAAVSELKEPRGFDGRAKIIKKKKKKKHQMTHCNGPLIWPALLNGHWGIGSGPCGEGWESSWLSIQLPLEMTFPQIPKKRSRGQGPGARRELPRLRALEMNRQQNGNCVLAPNLSIA